MEGSSPNHTPSHTHSSFPSKIKHFVLHRVFQIEPSEIKTVGKLLCNMNPTVTSYLIQRVLKDAMIFYYFGAAKGTPILAALKTFIVVPANTLFISVYGLCYRYIHRHNAPYVFYSFMGICSCLFLSLVFLMPNTSALSLKLGSLHLVYPVHQPTFSNWMESSAKFVANSALSGLIWLITNATGIFVILFYLTTELFGSTSINGMSWVFCNTVFTLQQSKRLNAVISFFANLGMVLGSGGMAVLAWHLQNNGFLFISIMLGVIFTCFMAMISSYTMIKKTLFTDFTDFGKGTSGKKGDVKMTITTVIGLFSKSYLITFLTLCIGSYMALTNCVDFCVKALFATKAHAKSAIGLVGNKINIIPRYCYQAAATNAIIGAVTSFTAIVARDVIKRGGPQTCFLGGAIVCSTAGFIFLGVFLAYNFELTPLWIVILLGQGASTVFKVFKYTFSDLGRESIFSTLVAHEKLTNSSALVSSLAKMLPDPFGGRYGKLAGSGVQLSLISILSTIRGHVVQQQDIVAYLLIFFALAGSAWIYLAHRLGVEIRKLTSSVEALQKAKKA